MVQGTRPAWGQSLCVYLAPHSVGNGSEHTPLADVDNVPEGCSSRRELL